MKYSKPTNTGAWADKASLVNGTKAVIVSETKPTVSRFKDKEGNPQMQDVAKVQFEGLPEALNVGLSSATLGGLIDAFGDDSANWQGHPLTVETEKVRVAGKAGISLYLIPEGFKKIDDENGFAVIVKDPNGPLGGQSATPKATTPGTLTQPGIEYPEANETNIPKTF
jgi:hypothetical protein